MLRVSVRGPNVRSWFRCILFAALASLAVPSLFAQEALPPLLQPRPTVWGERIDQALQEAAGRPELRAVLDGADPTATPEVWQHDFDATDFEPAGVRDVPERLAGNTERMDHRQISLELGRDILAGIESSPSFRRHNMAYALTLAITASLRLTDRRQFDAAQERRLLRIVNDALADAPAFRTSSAAERTVAYDALIVTAGLMSRMTDDALANKDRQLAERALTLARETLASLGIRR